MSSCYRPIEIWNKSLHFDIHQKIKHTVRCGHCEACLESRRRDWYIRSWYEYRSTCAKHGLNLAYTLTYDNEHVNWFHGKPAFRSSDIPLFIKRLRSYLALHLPDYDFKYLACPEYGEHYDRPHWHPIFHVWRKSCKRPLAFDFYNAVLATWQNGFIHVKKGSGYGRILSVDALRYTTKYVTKELGAYSLFAVNYSAIREAYRAYISDNPFDALSLYECVDILRVDSHAETLRKYYDIFRKFRNEFTPSVHASLRYGLCALDYLKDYDIDNMVCQIPSKGEYVLVAMPLYLKRKLFYTTIPNERDGKPTKYVLTETGLSHFQKMLDTRINDSYARYQSLFDSLSPTCFDYIKSALYARFPSLFDTLSDLRIYLSYYKSDWFHTAIYDCVYKGSVLNNDIITFDLFSPETYKFYYQLSKAFHEDVRNDSLANSLHRREFIDGYYSTKQVFEIEDNLSFVFAQIRSYFDYCEAMSHKQKSDKIQQFNDLLKFNDYEKRNR